MMNDALLRYLARTSPETFNALVFEAIRKRAMIKLDALNEDDLLDLYDDGENEEGGEE
ncbi:MAG: hypothetical protein F082_1297 [bacterium F082]|nr:MAG: hypothetical protein F082_1297 [bacterium F082]KWW31382.1 MAG: hypothetical protein AUK64_187 [bacterium P201]